MDIQRDFREFLGLLKENRVRFIVVGGYAVAFHGHPRYTKDLDIFYDPCDSNVQALVKAMKSFGFAEDELEPSVFTTKGNIVVFGIEPNRIDLLNEIDGIEFKEAYERAVTVDFGGQSINMISLPDLIANKRASGRTRDLLDAEDLSRIQ